MSFLYFFALSTFGTDFFFILHCSHPPKLNQLNLHRNTPNENRKTLHDIFIRNISEPP